MIDKGKGKKHANGTITEEDISRVLERYAPEAVLALLQEVAIVAGDDGKIDWNELVKKTSTGITSAREFQMLWRHLAYRHYLADDDFNKGAETPLVDDSDTEYELEAHPAVSNEASLEAAAYVKVHIDSGVLSDPSLPTISNNVQAPLTINIPYGQSLRTRLDSSQVQYTQGKNIIIPVCVQKQQLPVTAPAPAKRVNHRASPGVNTPSRKKQKLCLATENKEFIATAHKRGEGNSTNTSKINFKGEKSNAQLLQAESMQRWTDIKQQSGNLNEGLSRSNGPHNSKFIATRNALSAALDFNVGNLRSAALSGTGGTSSSIVSSNSAIPPAPEVGINNRHQPQSTTAPKSRTGVPTPASKPRMPSKNQPTKPTLSQSSVKDTAVAAGARVASPEDAASLIRAAANANNKIHIVTGGGSSIKTSNSCSTSSSPSTHSEVPHNNEISLNPVIATTMRSANCTATPSATRPISGKPANIFPEHTSNANIEPPTKQVVKISGDRKIINSSFRMIKQVQDDETSLTSSSKVHQVEEPPVKKQVVEHQQCGPSASPNMPIKPVEDQTKENENVNNVMIMDINVEEGGDNQFESKDRVVSSGSFYKVQAVSKAVV